jgi:hypothetical protein
MSSFLSELDPLIRAGPTRIRIEPGRAGLGPGLNSGLRTGLAGLVLVDHLYSYLWCTTSTRLRRGGKATRSSLSRCWLVRSNRCLLAWQPPVLGPRTEPPSTMQPCYTSTLPLPPTLLCHREHASRSLMIVPSHLRHDPSPHGHNIPCRALNA